MKSGYSIEWTSEAERNLSAIFDYLEDNWTQREISNFAERLETNLKYISEHPAAFPFYSKEKNVRRCVISSQTTIYYEVDMLNRIDQYYLLAYLAKRLAKSETKTCSLTNLKGLGKGLYAKDGIDNFISKERESWDFH